MFDYKLLQLSAVLKMEWLNGKKLVDITGEIHVLTEPVPEDAANVLNITNYDHFIESEFISGSFIEIKSFVKMSRENIQDPEDMIGIDPVQVVDNQYILFFTGFFMPGKNRLNNARNEIDFLYRTGFFIK